jgi:hypothetical protein
MNDNKKVKKNRSDVFIIVFMFVVASMTYLNGQESFALLWFILGLQFIIIMHVKMIKDMIRNMLDRK